MRHGWLLLVMSTCLGAGCSRHPDTVARAYQSPDQTVTWQLVGLPHRPEGIYGFFFWHELSARLLRTDSTSVQELHIHFADSFDDGFFERVDEPHWLPGNALRFPSKVKTAPVDRLTIRNSSGEAIALLSVSANDVYLVPGLDDSASIELAPSGQNWYPYLAVSGIWANGGKFQHWGRNVRIRQEFNMRSKHYLIEILQDKAVVNETSGAEEAEEGQG